MLGSFTRTLFSGIVKCNSRPRRNKERKSVNTQNIECPKCGAGIPLTEALARPILDAERNRVEQEMRQRSSALETREQELQRQRTQLASLQKDVQARAADVDKIV